MYEETVGCRSY